jgi:flagellar hook-associated protein 3 FlgL
MRVVYDTLRDGLAAINSAKDQLTTAQRQVATGRRIGSISEDPQAARQSVGAHATLGGIDAYRRTGDSAASRLASADAALGALVDKLTSAAATAHGARGSTTTPASRAAASAEIRASRDGLVSDLNTSFDGTYLFAGTATETPPYAHVGGAWTYQGDAASVQVEIDRGRLVAVSFDGRAIAQGSDATDLFTAPDALASAIDAGDSDAVGVGIDAIERAFDRASIAQGSLGAADRTVEETGLKMSALRQAAESQRAKLEDANLAEAIARMSQADTSYRGALGAVSIAERQTLLDYLR